MDEADIASETVSCSRALVPHVQSPNGAGGGTTSAIAAAGWGPGTPKLSPRAPIQ